MAAWKQTLKSGALVVGVGLGSMVLSWAFSPGASLWREADRSPLARLASYELVQPERDLDKAIAFYKERMAKNPQGFLDLIALGELYIQKARQTGENAWYLLAEQSATTSLQRYKQNPGALLVLAKVAGARHNWGQALKLTAQAEALNPRDLGVHSHYLTLYLGLGELEAAAQKAALLRQRAPSLGSYLKHGEVLRAQGQLEQAAGYFKRGIELEQAGEARASALARARFAEILARQGEMTLAEHYFKAALEIQPQDAYLHSLKADFELERGHAQAALAGYQQAFNLRPEAAYQIAAARAHTALGETEQAKSLWQAAESQLRREIEVGSYGHRRELAQLLLERKAVGDAQEALRLMRAEFALRQDSKTLDLMAWSLMENGKWQRAQTLMKTLLERQADNAQSRQRLAQIESQLLRPQQVNHSLERRAEHAAGA